MKPKEILSSVSLLLSQSSYLVLSLSCFLVLSSSIILYFFSLTLTYRTFLPISTPSIYFFLFFPPHSAFLSYLQLSLLLHLSVFF